MGSKVHDEILGLPGSRSKTVSNKQASKPANKQSVQL